MTLYIKLVPSSSFPSTTYTHTVVRLNFDRLHLFQPMISPSASLLSCNWLKDGKFSSYYRVARSYAGATEETYMV